MTRTRLAAVGASLATVCLLVTWAAPANAGWRVHNENDFTLMTPPPGGTELQTCTDSVVGEAGWGSFVSPEQPAPDPIPSSATTPANYELWKAPPGFSSMGDGLEEVDGSGNVTGYVFFDLNGNESHATLVKYFTTANRALLPTPVPVNDGDPAGDYWIYSSVGFDEAITGVSAGDVLGLRPVGTFVWSDLTAIDCSTASGYTFSGFFAPVDNQPTVNVGRIGRTYPVKFALADSSGATVSDLSAVESVMVHSKKCGAFCKLPKDKLETSVTGQTGLSFNAATGQFVYNWKAAATGCYTLTVNLADGQSFSANFRINK